MNCEDVVCYLSALCDWRLYHRNNVTSPTGIRNEPLYRQEYRGLFWDCVEANIQIMLAILFCLASLNLVCLSGTACKVALKHTAANYRAGIQSAMVLQLYSLMQPRADSFWDFISLFSKSVISGLLPISALISAAVIVTFKGASLIFRRWLANWRASMRDLIAAVGSDALERAIVQAKLLQLPK